jgi:hypothetical protein
MLIAVVLLVPAGMKAQTSVTLKGTVSATVALAVPLNSNIDTEVVSSGSTVRMTFSGTDESPLIRVPLIVRSNSSFKISAVFESTTAELFQMSVIDVRAMGSLVSPRAISELEVSPQLDVLLSGPRISLGGTLDSPNNGLQVTLLIRMKPQPARDWLVHLTLVGTAAPLIQ